MESRLTGLFDYQKFAGHSRLSDMLADVDSRYGSALSDDDLELVSAAGDADPIRVPMHCLEDFK